MARGQLGVIGGWRDGRLQRQSYVVAPIPPWVTAQMARSSTRPCGTNRSTHAFATVVPFGRDQPEVVRRVEVAGACLGQLKKARSISFASNIHSILVKSPDLRLFGCVRGRSCLLTPGPDGVSCSSRVSAALRTGWARPH